MDSYLDAVKLILLLALVPVLGFAAGKPNIVLIYADDIGYGDLGFNGGSGVATPNSDRLAKEGLNFSNGYSTAATCTPSRYSLLTGEYSFRQKGTGILAGDSRMIIEAGRATLASAIKAAGYKTGIVGKWHLGLGAGTIDWNGEIKPGPNELGFDEAFIMAATGDRVPCVYLRDHKVVNLDPDDPIQVSYKTPFPGELDGKRDRAGLRMDWSVGHNMAVVNGVGRIGYMTGGKAAIWKDETMAETFTHEAVAFIERSKDAPFFLYFATHNVHVPRLPGPRFAGTTKMGPRGDSLAEFDWQVGQVLETLDRLKLTDNTVVILTSDNGPVLDDGYKDDAVEKVGSHKPAGPFSGGKVSILEGGTRMPLVVRWPGTVKPGTSDAVISQVDFPATLAALAGGEFSSDRGRDSRNLLPALLGETKVGRDQVLTHSNIMGAFAVRAGDWKLISGRGGRGKESSEPTFRLFNLAVDPGETTNLAAKMPEKVQELRKLLPSEGA